MRIEFGRGTKHHFRALFCTLFRLCFGVTIRVSEPFLCELTISSLLLSLFSTHSPLQCGQAKRSIMTKCSGCLTGARKSPIARTDQITRTSPDGPGQGVAAAGGGGGSGNKPSQVNPGAKPLPPSRTSKPHIDLAAVLARQQIVDDLHEPDDDGKGKGSAVGVGGDDDGGEGNADVQKRTPGTGSSQVNTGAQVKSMRLSGFPAPPPKPALKQGSTWLPPLLEALCADFL